ncbi:AMP-binding protein [Maribellus comscasis]|uniref:AMP-binding protein n=1 Tax=Maribellus comscasis TaxID=2681766 RepID=A0A6I6JNZ9_9BACT|nr:AMP-binding protein [Maribellus comscasis]QGY44696.1 AMP-binding protein [Maribellus comscasis]
MNVEIKGLTVNNQYFTKTELLRFCESEIATGSAPGWKLDVYRFILDFLGDSTTIQQQTSGTTGAEKTIELSKIAMLTSAQNTVDFFHLKEGDWAVLCLPVQYIAGKMMVVRALLAGLNLKLIHPTGTPDFAGIGHIDFCAMVPMQATHLLEKNLWPNIKTLILGGAETGSDLLAQLQQVETQVFETYGMAETSSHVALKKLNGKDVEDTFTALPDVQLSTDERDCLVIETTYLPGKIITNDRVEMVSPNKFKWLGRFDNVINSGGIKIQPETLEKQFEDILQKTCTVLAFPDELLGQKMVLVVETSEKVISEEILEKLALHFDRKLLPKAVFFVAEFPRNKSFKIDRKALSKLVLKF